MQPGFGKDWIVRSSDLHAVGGAGLTFRAAHQLETAVKNRNRGSDEFSVGRSAAVSDQLIEVADDRQYELSGWAQAEGRDGSAGDQYFGFSAYDQDLRLIRPWHVRRHENAVDTRLAAALETGDHEFFLLDATGWANLGDPVDPSDPSQSDEKAHTRSLAWSDDYLDTDGDGLWDENEYTRNVAIDTRLGLWDAGAVDQSAMTTGVDPATGRRVASGGVQVTAYRVTLREPWAGGRLVRDTKVRNARSGGTYSYSTVAATDIGSDWNEYRGLLSKDGRDVQTASQSPHLWWPGTRFVRAVVLPNFYSLNELATYPVPDRRETVWRDLTIRPVDVANVADVRRVEFGGRDGVVAASRTVQSDSNLAVSLGESYDLTLSATAAGAGAGGGSLRLDVLQFGADGEPLSGVDAAVALVFSGAIPADGSSPLKASYSPTSGEVASVRVRVRPNAGGPAVALPGVRLRQTSSVRSVPSSSVSAAGGRFVATLDVLQNDAGVTDIRWASGAEYGSVAVLSTADGNRVRYRADDPTFVGTDSFTYSYADSSAGEVLSERVTVHVAGAAVNDSTRAALEGQAALFSGTTAHLAARDDHYDAFPWEELSVDAQTGVLANDATQGVVIARLVRGTRRGTLRLNADGSFEYRRRTGETAADYFEYEVFDGLTTSRGVARIDALPPDVFVDLTVSPELRMPEHDSRLPADTTIAVAGGVSLEVPRGLENAAELTWSIEGPYRDHFVVGHDGAVSFVNADSFDASTFDADVDSPEEFPSKFRWPPTSATGGRPPQPSPPSCGSRRGMMSRRKSARRGRCHSSPVKAAASVWDVSSPPTPRSPRTATSPKRPSMTSGAVLS